MTPEKYAYLAGLIDGEGTITITSQKLGRKGARNVRISYALTVAVYNTNRDVLDWLASTFGGTVTSEKRKKPRPNQKLTHKWRVSITDALALLYHVLPYLRIKIQQANIAIDFLTNRKKYRGTKLHASDTDTDWCESLKTRINLLNHRGV